MTSHARFLARASRGAVRLAAVLFPAAPVPAAPIPAAPVPAAPILAAPVLAASVLAAGSLAAPSRAGAEEGEFLPATPESWVAIAREFGPARIIDDRGVAETSATAHGEIDGRPYGIFFTDCDPGCRIIRLVINFGVIDPSPDQHNYLVLNHLQAGRLELVDARLRWVMTIFTAEPLRPVAARVAFRMTLQSGEAIRYGLRLLGLKHDDKER